MTINAKTIWLEVKENLKRLDECPRHLFTATEAKLGQKLTCERCRGTMDLTGVGNYIRGFVAAGREAEEIWPAFHLKRTVS